MGRRRESQDRDVEINQFREYLSEKELAENTIKSYTASMYKYFNSYSEITKENAVKWKAKLLNDGLNPKSVNIRLNAFNSYCVMLGIENEKVKTVRIHSATAVSNVISAEDYRRLLANLAEDGNLKWYYSIKLLAVTGARVSEYIRLKKSDFDRGYAEMWTKGKMRRIYIPESFRAEAKTYYAKLEPKDYLVWNRNGEQISTRGVSAMLQRFASKYAIDKKVMHPHSFRHLFALEFLKRNSNLSLLSDVMGHSSVSTTAIYTRMTKEQQIVAIDKTIDW